MSILAIKFLCMKYQYIFHFVIYRIQAISSVFPGLSKQEKMSLCSFAKKMENDIFAIANTKVKHFPVFCHVILDLNANFYFNINHMFIFVYSQNTTT